MCLCISHIETENSVQIHTEKPAELKVALDGFTSCEVHLCVCVCVCVCVCLCVCV